MKNNKKITDKNLCRQESQELLALNKCSQKYGIEITDLKQMYRNWRKFDILNTGYIRFYEVDDFMIEIGQQLNNDQRKYVQAVSKKKSVDLDFQNCIQIVLQVLEEFSKTDEGNDQFSIILIS